MENFFIKQWDENKDKLRSVISNTVIENITEYKDLVKLVFNHCITNFDEHIKFDLNTLTVIDHGDYQGTQIFLIAAKTYQPDIDEYVFTHSYYGSCSGCDTLMDIYDCSDYEGLPTEEQLYKYMALCLHLVQEMKYLTPKD